MGCQAFASVSVEHHEHAQGAETDASYGPCCRRTCSALQWYGHFAELLPATVDECLRLSQPESTRVGVSVRQSVAAAWCMAQLQASHPFFATNCVTLGYAASNSLSRSVRLTSHSTASLKHIQVSNMSLTGVALWSSAAESTAQL